MTSKYIPHPYRRDIKCLNCGNNFVSFDRSNKAKYCFNCRNPILKEYNKKYQKENPDYFNQKAKEFYQRNKIHINEKRRKNPFSLYSTIKRNARIRKLELSITRDEFKEWWLSQEQKCIYCDIPIERLVIGDYGKKLARRLSIDRADNSRGYIKDNLVLACLKCNFIKSNLLTFDEMREIGQKYLKPKWQL